MMDKDIIPKCRDNVEIVATEDGLILQQNELIHTLNDTGAEILELCDGKHTVQEIVHEMATTYPDDDVEKGINKFLEKAHASGLVEI